MSTAGLFYRAFIKTTREVLYAKIPIPWRAIASDYFGRCRARLSLMPSARRFPPPWSVEELNDACFVVRESRLKARLCERRHFGANQLPHHLQRRGCFLMFGGRPVGELAATNSRLCPVPVVPQAPQPQDGRDHMRLASRFGRSSKARRIAVNIAKLPDLLTKQR
jgi:hypothetical protein